MEKRPNDTIDTLRAEFANVRKTAIVGHIRPDGDCISSCLALYHYLKDNYGYEADVYLEPYPSVFDMLPDTAVIRHTVKPLWYMMLCIPLIAQMQTVLVQEKNFLTVQRSV